MEINKNYAYVYLDQGKIYIRNLFDSSNPLGFSQKNTWFEDDISGKFELDDTNNLLLSYLGNTPSVLYVCVEYEPYNNHDVSVLLYDVVNDINIRHILEPSEDAPSKKNLPPICAPSEDAPSKKKWSCCCN